MAEVTTGGAMMAAGAKCLGNDSVLADFYDKVNPTMRVHFVAQ